MILVHRNEIAEVTLETEGWKASSVAEGALRHFVFYKWHEASHSKERVHVWFVVIAGFVEKQHAEEFARGLADGLELTAQPDGNHFVIDRGCVPPTMKTTGGLLSIEVAPLRR